MKITKRYRLIALILAIGMAPTGMGFLSTRTILKKPQPTAVPKTTAQPQSGTVIETKNGIQTVSTATTLKPFPYDSEPYRAKDLAQYRITDFIDENQTPVGSLDSKKDVLATQLGNTDLYSNQSITGYLTSYDFNQVYDDIDYTMEAPIEEPVAEAEAMVVTSMPQSEITYDGDAAISASGNASSSTINKISYSTTNTQVENVDEADILKTDGDYIYYLTTRGIAIVKAGKSPKQTSSITAPSLYNYKDLYLSGNNLVIIAEGRSNDIQAIKNTSSDLTAFFVYDVKQPSDPKLVRSVEVEGFLETTRLSNNSIYFVTSQPKYYNYSLDSNLASAFPLYKDSILGTDVYAMSPQDIFMSIQNSSFYEIIGAFSLDNNTPIKPRAYEKDYNTTIYMNSNSLYLATLNNSSNPSIPKTKEPWKTVSLKEDNWHRSTNIMRFGITKNQLVFQNAGSLPGALLNQYSLDEYYGSLRIAITERDRCDKLSNGIYILDTKTMQPIGSVTGFAKGEEIKSARFRGKTGYLVTFENTDPLFVIDLSDSKKPKMVGELKIPGFSTYLHPYGEKYLIGVGRDTNETFVRDSNGNEHVTGFINGGVKLSLFDISNPQEPKEVSKLAIGDSGTDSSALSNPKSIMFDMKKNIMAFPINYQGMTPNNKTENWAGGMVVNFSPKGFIVDAKIKMDDYYMYNSRFAYINGILYYVEDKSLISLDYQTYKLLNAIDLKYDA